MALFLNGVNQWVDCGNPSTLFKTLQPWTYWILVKFADLIGQQEIASQWSLPNNERIFSFHAQDATLRCRWKNTTMLPDFTNVFVVDVWYALFVVHNTTSVDDVTYYIFRLDNLANPVTGVRTSTAGDPSPAVWPPLRIGGRANPGSENDLHGTVAEHGYAAKALTQSEMVQIIRQPRLALATTPIAKTLHAWHPLGYKNPSGDQLDISGQNHNGVENGTPIKAGHPEISFWEGNFPSILEEEVGPVGRTVQGDVTALAATTSGELDVLVSGSGDVVSQEASTSGELDLLAQISGDVASEKATVSGELDLIASISGDVAASVAVTSGIIVSGPSVSGDVVSGAAVTTGKADALVQASGDVISNPATTSGILTVENRISGDVASLVAVTTGSITLAELGIVVQGDVQAGVASTSGAILVDVQALGDAVSEKAFTSGEIDLIASVSGDVTSLEATTSGLLIQAISVSGDVAAGAAVTDGKVDLIASVSGGVAAGVAATTGLIEGDRSVSGDVVTGEASATGNLIVKVSVLGDVQALAAFTTGFIFMGTEEGRNIIIADVLADFSITADVLFDTAIVQG